MLDMRHMHTKAISRADGRILFVIKAVVVAAIAIMFVSVCFSPQIYGARPDSAAMQSAKAMDSMAAAGKVAGEGSAIDAGFGFGANDASSKAAAEGRFPDQPSQTGLDASNETTSQFNKERKHANAIQPDATLPGGKELEEAAKAEEEARRDFSAKATGKSLRKIPESHKLSTFVAYGSYDVPKLKGAQKKAIGKAVRAIEGTGADCGAVLVDLRSGCGVAYNAGKEIYTASAFKAPFVFYMLKRAGNKGIGEDDRGSVESTILYSSNDAYDSMTFSRMGQDYIEWLERYGVGYHADRPFYPLASTKSMMRIWADLYQYLESGSKDARWFSKLLADTNRSFIRDGVAGKSVTVRNKAGWISDEYSATTDCAYIDVKGRPYLMAVMTSQPASQTSFDRVSTLARQLFAARTALR